MSWQDIGITFIVVLLAVMLLPQLRDVLERTTVLNVFSSLFTSILAFLLCAIYATLGLWLSVAAQGTVALVWALLAYFSLRNVRDTAYPDETLGFVVRDFFSVWAMGVVFLTAKWMRRIWSRERPD
ncbi:hypothetical protein FGU65_13810 [Methanoculleus sp. FWC-SCC1]|uniref:Uncharacterized protein n=1 Tax=Methanoculleus frigidifontis TaxID=2584085 RepID=A0ABT8MDE5_9EURY|nr:hypothetical protein [Methanoculleus sp. FWC-SCC1]MDN7025946.1 hypothetical protein [Methanoculleus sp. FWC-SCC1]